MSSAEISPDLPRESTPDLFGRVKSFGAEGERFGQFVAVLGAIGFHVLFGGAAARLDGGLGNFAGEVIDQTLARLRQTVEIEQEVEAPPVVEEPEPEAAQPDKIDPPPDAPVVAEAPKEAPVAAAAEASAVLTQAPDPNEPLDLTGEGFVSGTGSRFAGGTTMANGTATTAVRATVAAPIGVVGSKGTAPVVQVAPAESKARPAKLAPGAAQLWKTCPFPPEADLENISVATVTLVVTVASNGTPKNISVVSESSPGFGRAAKRCGYEKGAQLFLPGLDDKGAPLEAAVLTLPLRFERQ